MNPRLAQVLGRLRALDPGRPRLLAIPLVLVCVYLATWQLRSIFVPIIIGEHDWRQADTYSVAYNFVHESFDFFRPRIDWSRGRSGVMGMEAPVYPWLTALVMRVFGDGPPVARFVAWCMFLGGVVAAMTKLRPAGQRTYAVGWLVMLFCSPMALFEFRQIQPDGPMVALLLVAAALFHDFSRTERRSRFVLGMVAFSLAALIKTPALIAGPAMWMLSWTGQKPSFKKIAIRGLGFVVPLVLAYAWMRWSAHLNQAYAEGEAYFWTDFEWSAISEDLRSPKKLRHVFFEVLPSYVTNWVFFPTAIAGAVLGFQKEHRPIAMPMLTWLAFGCFMCAAFSERLKNHWYYGLVLVPAVAYFGSLAIGRLLDLVTKTAAPPTFVDKWATAFVVIANLASPLAGGRLRELGDVPAANRFPELTTWAGESAFFALMMLEALAVAACLIPPFRRSRGVFIALATIGLLLAVPRAAHDAIEAFKARTDTMGWQDGPRQLAELRQAIDAVSTRKDLFVVDGVSPYYLYRPLRKGWVVDAEHFDVARRDELVHKGARFAMHFEDNGKRAPILSRHRLVVKGPRWELYCLDPNGCAETTTQ